MKRGSDGGVLRPGVAARQTAKLSSDIDRLAQEIFAILNDVNRKDTTQDRELRLAQAATTLVQPLNAAHAVLYASLQALPSKQRETLLLHLSGLTCTQIARRQGRAHRTALKDLTSAYTQLRFSLEPIERTDAQMPDATTLCEHEIND